MRLVEALRSQGLGILCGQATVLLLGVGSVVVAATRDGASRGVRMDDIRVFFAEPSWVHTWFYLLVAVMVLYALNTFLATWHSVVQRWRGGVRTLAGYAPSVIHVAFLVALVAHLVGGLWPRGTGGFTIGPGWRPIGDGVQARVVSMDARRHPNGQLADLTAQLEVRDPDGRTRTETLGFNQPVSSGFGSDLLLMIRPVAESTLLVQRRASPGHPIALLSALLLLGGIAALWRRFLPVDKQRTGG
jgi:hypothetical protein